MKQFCQLLIMLCIALAISACSHTTEMPTVRTTHQALPLQLPMQLGQWMHQGTIEKADSSRLSRYQFQNNSNLFIDVSLYPLANGWESLSDTQALTRHYSLLSQQLAQRLQQKSSALQLSIHGATITDEPNPQLTGELSTDNGQVTLILLSTYQNHFLRLVSTCSTDDRDARLNAMQQMHHQLLQLLPTKPQ